MNFIEANDEIRDAWDIIPPHGLAHPDKFDKIVSSMTNKGWKGRQVIGVTCREWDSVRALTGSHRIAAAGYVDIPIPVRILYFDQIDAENANLLLGWKYGYEDLRNWLRKWDKRAASIFRHDLKGYE